jgi:hypothetical protein
VQERFQDAELAAAEILVGKPNLQQGCEGIRCPHESNEGIQRSFFFLGTLVMCRHRLLPNDLTLNDLVVK